MSASFTSGRLLNGGYGGSPTEVIIQRVSSAVFA